MSRAHVKAWPAIALLLFGDAALAQQAPPEPKLIVAISVDQLSADLFAQYRNHFSGGFARLLSGAVFPSAYQSHAATETCPGHSTILTGMRPANTGIIANKWVDQSAGRPDKMIYCAEDERVPGSSSSNYTPSARHLRVPTLGARMKRATPATVSVSVAGKDRAAIMMGGHDVDQIWWWGGKSFVSYAGHSEPTAVRRANVAVRAKIARPQKALAMPKHCEQLDRPIRIGEIVVGQGRFEREADNAYQFLASPASDAAVFDLAASLISDMRLGKGSATDVIAIGASATDYVGHGTGTQGTEMCIQLDRLDRTLGAFFARLDRMGLDYQVMLTADHGAHDMTERQQQRAMPMEVRATPDMSVDAIDKEITAQLKLPGRALHTVDTDIYIDATLSPADRARVEAAALNYFRALPQVETVLTRAEIAATPMPSGPPETWTLLERARASFDAQRSGDLLLMFRPRVTPIAKPEWGYVEGHGSPWDYDRRVPLFFWRRGKTGFEQPLSVDTVDILPTLAAGIGLAIDRVDGRCLDLDPGPADTCP